MMLFGKIFQREPVFNTGTVDLQTLLIGWTATKTD